MNEQTPIPPLKVCAACGEGKPVEDFYRVRKDSETRFSYCKECAKKKSREWYKTHGRRTIKNNATAPVPGYTQSDAPR